MDFTTVWERINRETELESFSQLSNIIGKTSQNISIRKKKGDFPIEWAYLIGRKYNLTTEWILTGKGIKRRNQIKGNKYIMLMMEWLEELMNEDPRKEYWFQCIIEKALPEFKEWLDHRNIDEQKVA